jgi:hypothetical protein
MEVFLIRRTQNNGRGGLNASGRGIPAMAIYRTIEKPQLWDATIIFRGGSSLQARPIDFNVDPATGMRKTTDGLSLDVSAEAMSRFGGAFRIESIPAELRIIQRGSKNLGHFEIVPRTPMTPQRFQELHDQIKIVPATWSHANVNRPNANTTVLISV